MEILDTLLERYPALLPCREQISAVYGALESCFAGDGRLYVCGNGGSAADALHMVGELLKSFARPRPVDAAFAAALGDEAKNYEGALPAFALVENTGFGTAWANDRDPSYGFAQQVCAYARPGDCVLCISTSGRSDNILHALEAARARGAVTLGLSGRDGGSMPALCDCCIVVPETETYRIQELHLPIYHALCRMLEQHFWPCV